MGITKRVFDEKSGLAKILYLAIKSTHKVGESFKQDCLDASEYIRIYYKPQSPEELGVIVNKYFRKKGNPKYSKEFIDDLFLYIDGKKKLEILLIQGNRDVVNILKIF